MATRCSILYVGLLYTIYSSTNTVVLCDANDAVVFAKLALLEEEVNAIKSNIRRNEVKLDTDLRTFRYKLNSNLEEIAADVLSDVIDDKVSAGDIRGVVDGFTQTALRVVQKQLAQLKSAVARIQNRPQPLPPVKDANVKDPGSEGTKIDARAFDKLASSTRKLSRKMKRYRKMINDFKTGLSRQERVINDLKSSLVDHRSRVPSYTELQKKISMTSSLRPTMRTKVILPTTQTPTSNSIMDEVVSAQIGSTAILPCIFQSDDHGADPEPRVIWRDPDQNIISYNQDVRINDARFSIEHPYISEWNLHIQYVKNSDFGLYTCHWVFSKRLRYIQLNVTCGLRGC